jgi:hypothetical protein
VLLRSLAPVGLECTLGHEKWLLLISSTVLAQTVSINHPAHYRQTRSKIVFRLNSEPNPLRHPERSRSSGGVSARAARLSGPFAAQSMIRHASSPRETPRPAHSLRQLPARHLTAQSIRAMNNSSSEIPVKDFHITKKIVLVCRTDLLSKIFFAFGSSAPKIRRFPQ